MSLTVFNYSDVLRSILSIFDENLQELTAKSFVTSCTTGSPPYSKLIINDQYIYLINRATKGVIVFNRADLSEAFKWETIGSDLTSDAKCPVQLMVHEQKIYFLDHNYFYTCY